MKRPTLGILLFAAAMAITLTLWLITPPLAPIALVDQVRQVLGAALYTALAFQFLLASRLGVAEKIFGGFGNIYKLHRGLGIGIVAAAAAHGLAGKLIGEKNQVASALGGVAFWILLAVVAITMLVRIDQYELWRWGHRLGGIALLAATVHLYAASSYPVFAANLLTLWMLLLAALSIGCAVYVMFLYRAKAFVHAGKVVELQKLTPTVLRIKVALEDKLPLRKGQFVFIRYFQKGLEDAPHPFSVIHGEGKDITFAVKNSGDFTNALHKKLAVGTPVRTTRTFGQMNFARSRAKQVWIAGGIGITPFMAQIYQGLEGRHPVHLYYSYDGQHNAAFLEDLQQFAARQADFSLTSVDTASQPRLDFSALSFDADTTIFICGPDAMMEELKKTFRANGSPAELVFERFNFREVLNLIGLPRKKKKSTAEKAE